MIESLFIWVSDPTNTQLIAAGSTIFLVIFTGILAYFTGILAKQTATLAKMTSQPFVVCNLESSIVDPTALNLTLRNSGNGTAFDVKLELSPSLPALNGDPVTDEKLTRNVSLLPPKITLGLQVVKSEKISDKIFIAKISWASRPGARKRETLSYSFSPSDGFQGGVSTKGAHHIAQEVEKIRKILEKSNETQQRQ